MADQFLEESLPVSVRMGASYADEHDVVISESANGNEYRTLRSASPRRTFTVSFVGQNADLWNSLIALYHRAHGTYAGFRVPTWTTTPPTATRSRQRPKIRICCSCRPAFISSSRSTAQAARRCLSACRTG